VIIATSYGLEWILSRFNRFLMEMYD